MHSNSNYSVSVAGLEGFARDLFAPEASQAVTGSVYESRGERREALAAVFKLSDLQPSTLDSPLSPASLAPSIPVTREPDYESGYHPGPDSFRKIAEDSAPARPLLEATPKRSRRSGRHFSDREKRIRALSADLFCRQHYLTEKSLAVATRGLVDDMLAHLARAKGEVLVRDFNSELLYDFRDYFVTLLADGDIEPATANKHLRQLRAVIGHAAGDRLVKRVTFKKLFNVAKPSPTIWTQDQFRAIEEQCQKLSGWVCGIPARLWWFAWWRAISRAGCRLSAMMLAKRGDFQNGVLWLRSENQKQGEDQRIALPRRSVVAIEDLLSAHNDPRLFPWDHDPGNYEPDRKYKTNWKTLFAHFRRLLLEPCGIKLPKGVKTRMCRRTAATLANEAGGSGQRLCGHKSETTTKTHYIPRNRVPVIRDALLIPETDTLDQLSLFETKEG